MRHAQKDKTEDAGSVPVVFLAPVIFLAALLLCGTSGAADGGSERPPYGSFREGAYGEKRAVKSEEDARRVLREYFGRRDLRIGTIVEKDLYYEADILGSNGAVVDRVIVNKRNGRIRSVY